MYCYDAKLTGTVEFGVTLFPHAKTSRMRTSRVEEKDYIECV